MHHVSAYGWNSRQRLDVSNSSSLTCNAEASYTISTQSGASAPSSRSSLHSLTAILVPNCHLVQQPLESHSGILKLRIQLMSFNVSLSYNDKTDVAQLKEIRMLKSLYSTIFIQQYTVSFSVYVSSDLQQFYMHLIYTFLFIYSI